MALQIEVLTGPPGCGKSTLLRRQAIETPGRYVFSYPTLKLIQEQSAAFSREAPRLLVAEAHSRSAGSGAVEDKLEAARLKGAAAPHIVVLTSHEALMGSDFSDFKDWFFCIDEAPNAVQSGVIRLRTHESREFFRTTFSLSPLESGVWSEVRPTADRYRWRELADDDLLKPFAAFKKHAHRATGVYVKTTNWSEQEVLWAAAWLPDVLEGVATSPIRIAGATYMTSLGGLAAQRVGNATFVAKPVSITNSGQPTVHIHYFTEGHHGSTALWARSDGRAFIVALTDYLAKQAPKLGFWSGNDVIRVLMDHRAPGVQTDIKVAGLNEYAAMQSCACIYSAKPTKADRAILDLFPITADEIRAAREDEDILQYVMRGAIRRPDFAGEYHVYLYNRSQAERLQAQLQNSRIGKSITLVPEVNAGFMDAADPRPRPVAEAPRSMGTSGKLIKPKSVARAKQRAAKRGDEPPKKRGPKSKTSTREP